MERAESNRSSDWVEIAEVGQLWEAELIAGRLKAEEIDARIIDQTFHQEPIPTVRSFAVVRVMVPAAMKDQALRVLADTELLSEIEGSLNDDEPPPDS